MKEVPDTIREMLGFIEPSYTENSMPHPVVSSTSSSTPSHGGTPNVSTPSTPDKSPKPDMVTPLKNAAASASNASLEDASIEIIPEQMEMHDIQ